MKLERAHEYLLPVFATLGGMAFAYFCGGLSGKGQMGMLAAIFTGLILIGVLLAAQSNVWMLIPITWPLSSQIPLLAIPFAPRDFVVMAAFAGFLVLKAFKIVRYRPKFTPLDICLVVILAYLVTVFVRNPTGVSAFGSSRVGGRPYFNVFISALAYWVLARAFLSVRLSQVLPLFMLMGQLFEGVLGFITYHFPSTVPVLSRISGGVNVETYNEGYSLTATGEGSRRQTFLATLGGPLVLALNSFFHPFTLGNPLYIFRFLAFIFGLYCILLSGYRSMFVASFFWILASAYFRRGTLDVYRIGILAFTALALLLSMQGTIFNLPLSAQRTLSFLPGRWNPTAILEAKDSTEWRVYMWKAMLKDNKYIENKLLGDGFGFTHHQLEVMAQVNLTGGAGGSQENQMIVGGVHSGPISAIRYVGYVGLVMFTVLLIVLAREAWRVILLARGSPYFPLALFIGIPILWEPLNYIFIFGGFEGALPETIYRAGLLRMLGNSLTAHVPAPITPSEPAPPVVRPAREPAFAGARRARA